MVEEDALIFKFAAPGFFYLLILLPPIILFSVWLQRCARKKIHDHLGKRLAPFLVSSVSKSKRHWKLILECLVILFGLFSLARPQSGKETQEIKSEGVELILMIDVSTSMLAEDVRPSRLNFAKKEMEKILGYLDGDKVGIVAFAGSAALLSPMTVDKSALLMYLDSLSTSSVGSQGTEFSRALQEAGAAFLRGGVQRDGKNQVTRVIVIASDGEDNEKGAIQEAEKLSKEGVHIFSLAFGTEKGAPIPLRDGNGYLREYKKDESGKVILSQTKGTILKELSRIGHGSFYHATFDSEVAENIVADIQKLQKTQFASASIVNYNELYQIFLLIAILLGILEIFLGEKKSGRSLWKGRFEVTEK